MWIKLKSFDYLNPDSSVGFGVREDVIPNTFCIRVMNFKGTPSNAVSAALMSNVEEGYTSREDAQNALDALMSDVGFVQAQPPTQPEELSTDDDDKEESK